MAVGHEVKVLFGKALRMFRAGDEKLGMNKMGEDAPATLHISSSAFEADGRIPRRHSGEGDNLSPPLAWSGVPARARELVLICEDPDAPMPQPFIHWIACGISPGMNGLAEGVKPDAPEMRQGQNSGWKAGYTGPMPPSGHGVHHYHFQLFALDTTLDKSVKVERETLYKAMCGHVIAEGDLVGTYERK